MPLPLSDSSEEGSAKRTHGLSTVLFIAAVCSVIALIFTIGYKAKPRLENYVRVTRGAYPTEVVLKNPGLRVEGVERLLMARAHQIASANPSADTSLDEIRRVMEATGWFEPGVRVSRDLVTRTDKSAANPGDPVTVSVIMIDGVFRQPMALIRSGDADYLVDEMGVRLDSKYPQGSMTSLPIITGARAVPPAVGRTWDGSDMQAGMAVIAAFMNPPKPWWREIREVDVSNSDGSDRLKPRIMLVTREGHQVAWGRAPGDEGGIDVPAAAKLRMLDGWYLTHKKLGGPQGVLRVDKPLVTIDQ